MKECVVSTACWFVSAHKDVVCLHMFYQRESFTSGLTHNDHASWILASNGFIYSAGDDNGKGQNISCYFG